VKPAGKEIGKPDMGDAITVKNLTKTYGHGEAAVRALNNVSVSFEEGRFTAITGTSGSGKSTLLHLMGGLTGADSGEVLCGGVDLLKLNDTRLSRFRREQIGFVYQSFNLIPELTAKENILMPVRIGGKKPDMEYYGQLVRTLGIADRLTHYPGQLSGGQQQRVAIARALINRPKAVLCDEPTGNLDKKSGEEVLSLLAGLQSGYGLTIIMVTHDMHIAESADRVVHIEDGQISDAADP